MVVAPAMPPPITATDVVAGSTVLSPAHVRCEFVGGNASQNYIFKNMQIIFIIIFYFLTAVRVHSLAAVFSASCSRECNPNAKHQCKLGYKVQKTCHLDW